MASRLHRSVAFAVSSLLHASVVLWGSLTYKPDIEMPDFEFELMEVEVLDPNALQVEEAPPPVPPPVIEEPPQPDAILDEAARKKAEEEAAKKKAEEEAAKKKAEEEEAAEKTSFAKQVSRADQLAPPASTVYMLLVPKKIRKLPFADKAVDMLAPWPDFELLIEKGGFDALRDFDHMVIASANLRDWTQTFLAVDYKMSREELKAGIERAVRANGEDIEWIEEGDILRGNPKPTKEGKPDVDERWFVLLPDKVALYVREEFLPNIAAGPVEGEDTRTAGEFVSNLAHLRQFAARQPEAGLQLVLKDITRGIRLKKGIEGIALDKIDRLELSVEASSDPEMVIKITFTEREPAAAFENFFENTLGDIIDGNLQLKLFVGGIYEGAELERDGKKVTIRGEFTEKQIVLLLDQVASTSAKLTRKTPEELDAIRQQRLENWRKRRAGKLGPSVLDDDSPKAPTEGGAEPPPNVLGDTQ